MTLVARMPGLSVLPLAAVVAVSALAGHVPAVRPLDTGTALAGTCSRPPVFKPGYQRRPGYVVAVGSGFRFDSDAWVEGVVCTAGFLRVTASGDLAGDEEPRLTVVHGTDFIAAPAFAAERTVDLRLPHAGRVTLAFLNDYYRADVRVATLRNVTFTAPSCQGFRSVDVPLDSAGTWNPVAQVATLVRGLPMALTPCAAGLLTMQVQGREGHGAYPVLAFGQGGQVLKTLVTGAGWQSVAVPLTAATATITVTNPYGRTLADRNLNVKRLEFIPDPAPP